MAREQRPGTGAAPAALVGLLVGLALPGPGLVTSTPPPEGTVATQGVVNDDLGDKPATTTFDGPLLRRRTAIAIHPAGGADRDRIRRQLRASATGRGLGPLSDATFAVFEPRLLRYLVPEVVLVLPEGVKPREAEAFMRDHRPPAAAFYVVEDVLVHDLTFALISSGRSATDVLALVDREGVLADSLGRYATEVHREGLIFRYFGAVLSDGQILAVRESIARAAGISPDRVMIQPSSPGPGVQLPGGPGSGDHHD